MRRIFYGLLALLILAGAYSGWVLSRPLPELRPVSLVRSLPAAGSVPLSWPGFGESALGADGYGLLATNGSQQPLPTASVAKLVTALCVLQKQPLQTGQQGPMLTMGPSDLQYYDNYVAEQGSVVPVNYGEQISEYQVLQAMLLPSANNMAESLAVWAFGSLPAYTSYANAFVRQLGMDHTHIADASGFSPATTSTAGDLVKLGIAAHQSPVLAQIVAQPSANIPVAGTVYNYNRLLGTDGINGMKTGNNNQDAGVFLASATYQLAGHTVTLISVTMGASSLGQAMQSAPPLLKSAQAGFAERSLLRRGEVVAYYNTPWHTSANAVASSAITAFGWRDQPANAQLTIRPIAANSQSGQTVGSLSLTNGPSVEHVNIRLQQSPAPPSWQWRLLHP